MAVLRSIAVFVCAFFLCATASADYPVRPVRIIVPFAPGGAVDTIARIVAQKITDPLGQSVFVENHPGAGSMVGTAVAVHAAPDGYTLLLGTASALLINPLLQKLPYDPMKAFVPVAEVGIVPYVLVSSPTIPATNLREFIAYARAHPNQLSYASPGVGTPHHIAGEMFKKMAHVDMVHVPYKGSDPAMVDVMGGRVAMMPVEILAALPNIKSGKLRALGIATPTRSSLAPDIPTVAEAGLPGFEITAWYGVVAPTGVPQNIVDLLARTIGKALTEPDTLAKLAAAGVTLQTGSPADFAALMQRESAKWARVVKETGVHLD